jgi:propanol-preferring alcohol dehydrogenase
MQLPAPAPIERAPLKPADLPTPEPGPGELVVSVRACGVCHTDLHIVEGDLPLPKFPIVPGHQVVGTVVSMGAQVKGFAAGDRVGVAWLHSTCGRCRFCVADQENLCENARFTGLHVDGGFAQFIRVPADFAYVIPEGYANHEAAPLLCSGIIGYRALRRSRIQPGGRLGLYGFGGSAHVAIQIARHWGCEVFVFTRAEKHRGLARDLGAAWVGEAGQEPAKLHSAIIFAPAGSLVPLALRALDKGGTLALAGITMTPTPELDYPQHLYHERTVTSVANATRQDGRELLALAAELRLMTHTEQFPLSDANRVLRMLKESRIEASAVLRIPD